MLFPLYYYHTHHTHTHTHTHRDRGQHATPTLHTGLQINTWPTVPHPTPPAFSGHPEKMKVSVSVSVSAQDGIVALGKAHTRSAPSLSSLPKVALETVPIFVWLNTDRSRPWRVECRPLPFSTPLSFRRSML